MTQTTNYNLSNIVYLKTDTGKVKPIVRAFLVCANNIQYGLCFGTTSTWHHYELEFTRDDKNNIGFGG